MSKPHSRTSRQRNPSRNVDARLCRSRARDSPRSPAYPPFAHAPARYLSLSSTALSNASADSKACRIFCAFFLDILRPTLTNDEKDDEVSKNYSTCARDSDERLGSSSARVKSA